MAAAVFILTAGLTFAKDTGIFFGAIGSASVTTNNPISVAADPEVSVEFALWFPEKYGALWSVQLNESDELSLSFKPNSGGGSFIIAYNAAEEAAQFLVESSALNRFTRHSLSMRFPVGTGEIFFSLAGDSLSFFSNRSDVRRMAFETAHHNAIWSLHSINIQSGPAENRGTQSWDFTSGMLGEPSESFTVFSKEKKQNGILTFPLIEEKQFSIVENSTDIIVFSNSGIHTTSYERKTLRHISYQPAQRIENGLYHWDSKNGKLYTFHGGGSPLFDISRIQPYPKEEFDDHFHGQQKMTDPNTGDVYMAGGYGFQTFKNSIRKYDWNSRTWNALDVKGLDAFEPRILHDLFPKDSNAVFFFGGHGNPAGNQDLGIIMYNDLYVYEFDAQKITEISDDLIPELESTDAVRGVFSAKENCLYLFQQKNADEDEESYKTIIWRIALGGAAAAERMMTIKAGAIESRSLRYDESNDLIMFIEKKKDHYGKSFIISKAVLLPIDGNTAVPRPESLAWLIAAGIAVILAAGFLAFRKSGESNSPQPPVIPEKGIAIVLGDSVTIFKDGTEVDLSGEKRHKQITALLAVLAAAPDFKLSHAEIKEALWPLVMEESFVNSLNVTLSAARKILTPYGTEIIHQAKAVALSENITVIGVSKK
ncbi:MAG: hypothetical protein QF845_06950 [Candidatus Marinimicrobia bacterium]|nr:hypothetical protein [Candidatus Neomarinimicrobiota bacterium]